MVRRRLLSVPLLILLGCGSQSPTVSDSADATAARASSYASTRYPIVLVHGMSGFSSLLGVFEYFYGIPEALSAQGAKVFVTQASPFNTPEQRGEQVLAQVEQIVAQTGAAKVNLIGHSHGGFDVRYVAAVRPDLVASVTTVGSPHQGAALADFLRSHLAPGGFDEAVLAAFANSLGFLLSLLEGQPTLPENAVGGLDSLTSAGAAAFNAHYPAGLPKSHCGSGDAVAGGIHFWSWTGTGVATNPLDITDGPLFLSSLVYSEPNDGLVGKCSAHLGTVLRDDYFHNHLDEVNQIAGLRSIFASDPVSIFVAHANRLKLAGL